MATRTSSWPAPERGRSRRTLSDGASALVEIYGLADWTRVLAVLEADGPDDLISLVREAEASDPVGARWPRYKRGDDATAVFCRLT